jgi:hypothetical protein
MRSDHEDFLARADKCREMAKRFSPENRAHLMRIAAAWERLAQEEVVEAQMSWKRKLGRPLE